MLARLGGYDRRLQSGPYELIRGQGAHSALKALTGGHAMLTRFTVPEGFTLQDIAAVGGNHPSHPPRRVPRSDAGHRAAPRVRGARRIVRGVPEARDLSLRRRRRPRGGRAGDGRGGAGRVGFRLRRGRRGAGTRPAHRDDPRQPGGRRGQGGTGSAPGRGGVPQPAPARDAAAGGSDGTVRHRAQDRPAKGATLREGLRSRIALQHLLEIGAPARTGRRAGAAQHRGRARRRPPYPFSTSSPGRAGAHIFSRTYAEHLRAIRRLRR